VTITTERGLTGSDRVRMRNRYILILLPPDYILKKQKLLSLREAHEFTRCVTRSLVLCVCFVDRCLSFVLFLLVIVLSVLLQYTDYDYPLDYLQTLLHTKCLVGFVLLIYLVFLLCGVANVGSVS
jgi:hypothetical protein